MKFESILQHVLWGTRVIVGQVSLAQVLGSAHPHRYDKAVILKKKETQRYDATSIGEWSIHWATTYGGLWKTQSELGADDTTKYGVYVGMWIQEVVSSWNLYSRGMREGIAGR